MTFHEIIDELHRRHIRIAVQEGNLLIDAPKGKLTEKLRQALKNRKPELIAYFSTSRLTEKAASVHSIPPAPEAPHYQLSHAQRRLWVLNQFEGGGTAYNMPGSLTLETRESHLDTQALEQAFVSLIQRHETLRTVFLTIDGELMQKILEEIDFTIDFVDLTNEAQPEVRAREFSHEDAVEPFDLSMGPLFRVSLLKITEHTYIMLFNMHHIISDGWSMMILVREFCQLYNYFTSKISDPKPVLSNTEESKIPYPLSPLRIQYKDYAAWQKRLLTDATTLSSHQTYWHEKLAGKIPVLELPTDFPRPAIQTFKGTLEDFPIEPALFERMQAFSREKGVSLFMMLVALVKVLLYHYTAQEDIIVGSPIAGRNHPDLEEQIGLYINTLALRDRVQGDQSFEDFLQQVKQTTTEAYDHQVYPFDRLVEELNVRRDLSRSALFDVMVVLQNTEDMEFVLEGLEISPFEQDTYISKFDLTFRFSETQDGLGAYKSTLRMNIAYNTDLFRKDRIRRMGAHFSTLLNSVLSYPTHAVNRLKILPDAERYQLLNEFNDTTADYPPSKTIVDLFEGQVEKTPENIAVVFEDTRLTYRELNEQANQIAHYLRSLNVQPEVAVGICVERSVEMIVGLLGILKAGGAYVPLEPEYPIERLLFMLKNSQAQILLTQDRLAPNFSERIPYVISLDANRFRLAQECRSNPDVPLKTRHLVYIIYTSGSTGQPKGVALEHRSLLNYLYSIRERLNIQVCRSFAMVSTIAADLGHTILYSSLLNGGCLHILSKERVTDSQGMAEYFDKNMIDCLKIVPSHLLALQSSMYPEAGLPCKLLILGGEAVSLPWLKSFQEKVPIIVNHYGPTEATIGVLTYQITGTEVLALPIGKPLANTQIYILDQYLHPRPIGVPGELHIGGTQLARGYFNRPDLTKEKFIRNPFSAEPASRLYRTGDLARYLPDGNVEFLGRVDHQVKIRGYRVEIGEVEANLAKHEDVKEVVVVAKDSMGDGTKELVAYIVTSNQYSEFSNQYSEFSNQYSEFSNQYSEFSNQYSVSSIQSPLNTEHWPLITDLREHLKRTLPDQMIPAHFVYLEKIPLTSNGKIDRKALPDLTEAGIQRSTEYIAPRDLLELQLAQIWEKVLNTQRVGVQDNFFEIGGHSLIALRLMAEIRQTFGKDLPLSILFREPTVEQLANILRRKTESSWSPLVAIQPKGTKPPFFCLPGGGGHVLYLYHLAHSLGLDQPFYGLEFSGSDGSQEPLTRIEDMAALYITVIQTVQPQGPYRLGGHSFGAFVAFEMAQQLQKQGHVVDLLVILDTRAPVAVREVVEPDWDEARWLVSLAEAAGGLAGKALDVSYEALRPLAPDEQFTYVNECLKTINWLPPEADTKHLRGVLQVYKMNTILGFKYVPQAIYPGTRIALFQATDPQPDAGGPQSPDIERDPVLGWNRLSDRPVEVYQVPGNHLSMMHKPQVQILAEQLKACIEEVLPDR